jgi:hypothetical protein
MKTLPSKLITLFLFFAIISSCKKGADNYTTDDPVTNNGDGTYLQKFIYLDTTLATGIDTSDVFEFSYDAQKRLSGYVHMLYNPGVTGTGRFRSRNSYTYSYQSNDTLPYRVIEDKFYFANPANNGRDTVYHFYQNGNIVKDSIGNASEYATYTFAKLSPTRTRVAFAVYRAPSIVHRDTMYSFTNWQNGNVIQEIDSAKNPITGIYRISDINVSYDSKPNPFKKLVLPYYNPYAPDIDENVLEGYFSPTANNNTYLDWDSDIYITRYQYGTNGLPLFSWDNNIYKGIYKYVKL